MSDAFLVIRNYGKLSAKFLLGTSTVIEKVGFLSYFFFLSQTTIRIRLKFLKNTFHQRCSLSRILRFHHNLRKLLCAIKRLFEKFKDLDGKSLEVF